MKIKIEVTNKQTPLKTFTHLPATDAEIDGFLEKLKHLIKSHLKQDEVIQVSFLGGWNENTKRTCC